jgi:hypothetical protein
LFVAWIVKTLLAADLDVGSTLVDHREVGSVRGCHDVFWGSRRKSVGGETANE